MNWAQITAALQLMTGHEADRCWSCGNPTNAEHGYACGECGHTWATTTDLVVHDLAERTDRWRREGAVGAPPPPRPAPEILSCPCCAHDF